LGSRAGLGRAMKRGEVRWYKFAKPDKNRPVVILTRNSALEFLGEVTVAPITSIIRDIPTEVLLAKEDGMSRDCAVNLDHIQTVSKGKIGALITTLSSAKMSELRSALLFAFGF
jgi:mRNA interferase MazF